MFTYGFLVGTDRQGGGRFVEVREDRLHLLLRQLLKDVAVDEAWYRRTYSDVDAAIRSGEIRSAQEHYQTAGYFENRLPREILIDSSWYLSEYPDVAEAIRLGTILSAEQHFQVAGFKEGRLPHRGWSLHKSGDVPRSRHGAGGGASMKAQ